MRAFVRISLFGWALVGAAALAAAEPPGAARFATYEAMRAELGRLVAAERFGEAERLLTEGIEDFPERLRANTFNLAYVRSRLGDGEGAAAALERALAAGEWYGKFDFLDDGWAALRASPRFAGIARQCEARRAEAEKAVQPRLDVVVPPGTPPGVRLPLFLALHGGGENVDALRPHWTSPLLAAGFVVAYPQSTQLVAPNGFDWLQDLPRTLAELRAVHARLLRDYPVDPARVVVGGFSSGGAAALAAVAADAFPVAGFVSLCPARPDGFDAERLRSAAARGVRGVLLTTARDRRVGEQREMAAEMARAGLLAGFSVSPDAGHWYPPDLAVRLDAALRDILPALPEAAAVDRSEVERAVRDSIGWALAKDRLRLESLIAHDDGLLIFHPDSQSTVRGWQAFVPLVDGFMDPRFRATRSEVRELATTFSRAGDVAWFSALLDDCAEWEGSESCWRDARWTGVLEKREGRWVIVQMHFSLAADAVRREALAGGS